MIIEARGDVVTLRGKLFRNEWQNIKAAANHLLHNHPHGIIIDCGHIESATEEGIETFIDARLDIEALGSRLMLCNVPGFVLEAMRSVPGASSQLPVARGIDEARASLLLMRGKLPPTATGRTAILVPLFGPGDADLGVPLACRIAERNRAVLHIQYVVLVPRALPLGTSLGEESTIAEAELKRAEVLARQAGLQAVSSIEQTRSLSEAILQTAKSLPAHVIALGLRDLDAEDDQELEDFVLALLHHAHCEVIVSRAARRRGEGGKG